MNTRKGIALLTALLIVFSLLSAGAASLASAEPEESVVQEEPAGLMEEGPVEGPAMPEEPEEIIEEPAEPEESAGEPAEPIEAPVLDGANSGSAGENVTWTLSEDGHTLTISGTGPMEDYTWRSGENSVTSMWLPWENNMAEITRVVVEEGVTTVGGGAFKDLSALETVELPEGIESVGMSAFDGCVSLTELELPSTVTEIGETAFKDCTSLYSVGLPEGLRTIGPYAFEFCEFLNDIKLPSTVTALGAGAFAGCESLYSMKLPSSLRSIGKNTFDGCAALTALDIPAGVESIGEGTFAGCVSLTELTLHEGLRSIAVNAFGDSGLKAVTIPASVTEIEDYAFDWCSTLERIDVAAGSTAYASADGVLFDAGMTTLIKYPEGKTGKSYTVPDGVTALGPGSMFSVPALEEVTLPDSVTSLGKFALNECENLTVVNIGAGLKTVGFAAFKFTALTDVYYAGTAEQWRAILVEENNDILLNAAVWLPDGSTVTDSPATPEPTAVPTTAPAETPRATEAPDIPPAGAIVASGYCGAYTKLMIDAADIAHYRDFLSRNVRWTLDANGTLTLTGEGAMCACHQVTFGGRYIIVSPWYDVRNDIKRVVIGDGITNVGQMCFRDCENLTDVVLPVSIRGMGLDTLDNTSVSDIWYKGTEEQWNAITKQSGSTSGTIHYNYGAEPAPTAVPTAAPTAAPTAVPTAEPTAGPAVPDARGDVNGDGKTDRGDRAYLACVLAGRSGYALSDEAAADVNGDGAADRLDRIGLARVLAGRDG